MSSSNFQVLSYSSAMQSIDGTCLVGYLNTTYDTLVSKFGKPQLFDDHTLMGACEWIVLFADGSIATIYPLRTLKAPPRELYSWHVGGNRLTSLSYLSHLLRSACVFCEDEDPEVTNSSIPF